MPQIRIVEVAPRDGLQNETAAISTDAKIAFVNALSASGVGEIEVSSFVSPRKVPQLGDAEEVFRGIDRRPDVVYSALVPNAKGLERALAARVDKIAVFTAVSETFNRKNIDTGVEGSLRRFAPLARRARQMGLPVRGYVSTAFWCPFEGRVAPEAVVDLSARLVDIGIDELAISDTIGKASPEEVAELLDILLPGVDIGRIAVHFHDTYGRGVANVMTSRSYGIRIFDGSAGGLGGCPFAPGATGNVATEAVVEALAANGETVGVDTRQLIRARQGLDRALQGEDRPRPQVDAHACAVCEYYTGEPCCRPRSVSAS